MYSNCAVGRSRSAILRNSAQMGALLSGNMPSGTCMTASGAGTMESGGEVGAVMTTGAFVAVGEVGAVMPVRFFMTIGEVGAVMVAVIHIFAAALGGEGAAGGVFPATGQAGGVGFAPGAHHLVDGALVGTTVAIFFVFSHFSLRL